MSALIKVTATGFKPALISKGLRLGWDIKLPNTFGFKPALISKGLRQETGCDAGVRGVLQASPDFKGIKTHRCE